MHRLFGIDQTRRKVTMPFWRDGRVAYQGPNGHAAVCFQPHDFGMDPQGRDRCATRVPTRATLK